MGFTLLKRQREPTAIRLWYITHFGLPQHIKKRRRIDADREDSGPDLDILKKC